jgi:hypothetical protein
VAEVNLEQQSSASSTIRFPRLNFPALGYALLPILLAVRHVNAPPDTRTYGPSHWFLDYHQGFMRRALIGQVLSHIHFISWRNIFLIEAVVLACCIALTYLIFRSIIFGNLDERLLGAFLLAAPAFLPHMATAGGELDNFLYIVLLLGCFCLTRFQNIIGLLLGTFFTALALFMHEAFLLMFYPLVLVLILDLFHRRKITRLQVGFHGLFVILCFLAILVFGKFHGTQADLIAQAQQRTDMPIEKAVFIPLHNTFREQLAVVRQRYTPAFVRRVALTLLLSIPYAIALWRLLIVAVKRQRYAPPLAAMITAAFFIPLCLIPLGHDIMRWLAALSINMSLYVLFIYQEVRSGIRSYDGATADLRHWAASPATVATLVYLVALGPWGLAGNHLFSNINSVLSGTSGY